jgi:hypothetical protein
VSLADPQHNLSRKLRVIIDFDPEGGEPTICPVAESDVHRAAILDALRVYVGETEKVGER